MPPAAAHAAPASLPPPLAEAARHRAVDGGGKAGPPSALLAARKVTCSFPVRRGLLGRTVRLTAVDGVSIDLAKAEILALVGESGCGKSTLARVLLGIQNADAGEVLLDGRPLDAIAPLERARLVQPVFQDPFSSLNPRRRVSEIVCRPLDVHGIGDAQTRLARVEDTMDLVGLPRRLLRSYPAQLSGGQRQRVAIARAIILRPRIVVCDEPTSALDLSVQAQILNLLLDLRDTLGLSIVIITHDLAVVGGIANRVAVMYLGQVVEQGASRAVLDSPRHPYTRALLKSVLTPDFGAGIPADELGPALPDPLNIPSGCRFHPRCPEAFGICAKHEPPPHPSGDGEARCHLHASPASAPTASVA
jgi:peptide/nickel transport system ATP-binding protein